MIKVGSRDSRLAVVQAEEVMRRLGECELVTMKTTGDKILDRTLDKVGGKGLFVKELDRALAAGEVDLTVHSLKDVPMEQPDGLPLIAFPKRADARDALVLPENGNWDREKPIGCSSARLMPEYAFVCGADFRKTYRSGNDRLHNRQAFSKLLFDGGDNILSEVRIIRHRQKNAADLQLWIDLPFDVPYRTDQFGHVLGGEIFCLHGDEHIV